MVADLTDIDQAARLVRRARPDAVFHLAGGQAPTRAELLRSNVDATSALLRALADRDAPLDLLVVTGSAAEYGDGDGTPLSERSPLRPVTPYGHAKVAQRQLCRLMQEAVTRRLVHTRPFNVVSPELPATTPLGNVRRQLLAGGDRPARLVCGRLDIVRDFVPLPDVVRALAGLLGVADPPADLNICSGVPVLLADLVDELVRASGAQCRPVQDARLLALPAAREVVGDTGRLRSLGLHAGTDVRRLAALLLATAPDPHPPTARTSVGIDRTAG